MKTLETLKKPAWIKKTLFKRLKENNVKKILKSQEVFTVCQEARCPNLGECFSNKTATFLLLGNVCTRNCKFCNISENKSDLCLDSSEHIKVANSVQQLGLRYVVLTSVTRDDLEDGGAFAFVSTIEEIHKRESLISIEVLTPDFKANKGALDSIISTNIAVFNHNLETVSRLYPAVRPEANYNRSLEVLEYVKVKKPSLVTKTGIMVGLGEREEEVFKLMKEIKEVGVDILTIGQYLSPGKLFYPVQEYIEQKQYNRYVEYGKNIGISQTIAGTFVRSSYFAEKSFINVNLV